MKGIWEWLINYAEKLIYRLEVFNVKLTHKALSPLLRLFTPGTQLYNSTEWWYANSNAFAWLITWNVISFAMLWSMIGLRNPVRLCYTFLEERVWGWRNYKSGWETAVLMLFGVLTLLSLYFPHSLSTSLLYVIDEVIFRGLEIAVLFIQACIVWFIVDFWVFPGSWVIELAGTYLISLLTPFCELLKDVYNAVLPWILVYLDFSGRILGPCFMFAVELIVLFLLIIFEVDDQPLVLEWEGFLSVTRENVIDFARDLQALWRDPSKLTPETVERFSVFWFGPLYYNFWFWSLTLRGYGCLLNRYRPHFGRWLLYMNTSSDNSRRRAIGELVRARLANWRLADAGVKEPSPKDLYVVDWLLKRAIITLGPLLYLRFPKDTDYLFNNNKYLLLRFILFAQRCEGGCASDSELQAHLFWLRISPGYIKTIRHDRNWGTQPTNKRSPYFDFLKRWWIG